MDTTAHPCFDNQARLRYSRVHLPVAAACNVQCNYCDRRFDCANESRPGVTSALLTPEQAVDYVDAVLERDDSLRVVGIAGPGDPLASAAISLQTLRLVRERHPEMLLCLATNGLNLPRYAEALAQLKVSHVTVTVNAVDPDIGAKMYQWISNGGEVLRGRAAGERLLAAQRLGIQRLVELGVLVKINSILVPGVNDEHIPAVAKEMAELGAAKFNCLPLHPVSGTHFGHIAEPTKAQVHDLRAACGEFLPQMEHCARCRADAVGRIGHIPSEEQLVLLRTHAQRVPVEKRARVAVASEEGTLVNQHLGEASVFWVFERRGDGYLLVDQRLAPTAGRGDQRWQELARLLADCRALLAMDAGASPKRILGEAGIDVYPTEGLIEDLLDTVYQDKPLPKVRPNGFKCGKGATCGGNGMMCG
ncbi:MAG TPA: radical SAM protein [Polyangiaceae bacterium]